jgi:hypothetical protein
MREPLDTTYANARSHIARLYARAFAEFGAECLWSRKPVRSVTTEHARVIAQALKREGGVEAYRMARELEEACDAADSAST